MYICQDFSTISENIATCIFLFIWSWEIISCYWHSVNLNSKWFMRYMCVCVHVIKINQRIEEKFQNAIKHQLVKKVSESIYYTDLIIVLLFTDAKLTHQNPQSFVISWRISTTTTVSRTTIHKRQESSSVHHSSVSGSSLNFWLWVIYLGTFEHSRIFLKNVMVLPQSHVSNKA